MSVLAVREFFLDKFLDHWGALDAAEDTVDRIYADYERILGPNDDALLKAASDRLLATFKPFHTAGQSSWPSIAACKQCINDIADELEAKRLREKPPEIEARPLTKKAEAAKAAVDQLAKDTIAKLEAARKKQAEKADKADAELNNWRRVRKEEWKKRMASDPYAAWTAMPPNWRELLLKAQQKNQEKE